MDLICKNRVEMGREQGKKDMVFCIINAKNVQPYKNSKKENLKKDTKEMVVSIALAQFRITDGKIGFPGGKVENYDETLIQALCREVKEEINYDLDVDKLKPLATFGNEKHNISSFTYDVSLDELDSIVENASKAVDYSVENSGMIKLHLHKQNIPNILAHNWCGTASKELELFMKQLGLI